MLASLLVCLCIVFSAQATTLTQEIKPLHLHGKFGGGLPEIIPEEDSLALVDKHASSVAKNFLREQIPRPFTFLKPMYGPIQNVVIPGVNVLLPVNLTNIDITGLKKLRLNDLQWRMAKNRVDLSLSLPHLLLDVTFEKLLLLVSGVSANSVPFYTNIRFSVRLMNLDISAAFRYNTGVARTDPALFIDKADVQLNATEALFDINVDYGVEEIRYALAEMLNYPLEVTMDAVLKIVVQEINREILAKVSPAEVISYLIAKIPPNINIPKNLISITQIV